MQRLSYATETVLSSMINRNRIVLSFKDSPRKPLGRRPTRALAWKGAYCANLDAHCAQCVLPIIIIIIITWLLRQNNKKKFLWQNYIKDPAVICGRQNHLASNHLQKCRLQMKKVHPSPSWSRTLEMTARGYLCCSWKVKMRETLETLTERRLACTTLVSGCSGSPT